MIKLLEQSREKDSPAIFINRSIDGGGDSRAKRWGLQCASGARREFREREKGNRCSVATGTPTN